MYQPKNFDHLIGLPGFSEQLIKNHITLYQGYVTNTNKLIEILNILSVTKTSSDIEYAEAKRRFGWEYNGMRLHEYYFENLTKTETPLNPDSKLSSLIISQFGSLENWEKDFKKTGATRGIGWTILVHDKLNNQLFNIWVNEHDLGYLVDTQIILVMDVFEHAYMIDYGIKRADYINAFFKIINWNLASERFGK